MVLGSPSPQGKYRRHYIEEMQHESLFHHARRVVSLFLSNIKVNGTFILKLLAPNFHYLNADIFIN